MSDEQCRHSAHCPRSFVQAGTPFCLGGSTLTKEARHARQQVHRQRHAKGDDRRGPRGGRRNAPRSCWPANRKQRRPIEKISDAPDHVWRRGTSRYDANLVGNTVTIGKPPRGNLSTNGATSRGFPRFMENVESVERLDDKRSRWTIKAPAGSTVELVTRDHRGQAGRERSPGRASARSDIKTEGRVEFLDAGARARHDGAADHALRSARRHRSARRSPSCSSASRRSRRAATCAASSS